MSRDSQAGDAVTQTFLAFAFAVEIWLQLHLRRHIGSVAAAELLSVENDDLDTCLNAIGRHQRCKSRRPQSMELASH